MIRMMIAAALLLSLSGAAHSGPPQDDDLDNAGLSHTGVATDRSWHLLAQSNTGEVSLIRNLTRRECEYARNRVLGQPATPEERAEVERSRKEEREANGAACPPGIYSGDGPSKDEWAAWHKKHRGATGCNFDGGGGMGWGVTVKPNRPIRSAECFQ
jgi:hypothetical protein